MSNTTVHIKKEDDYTFNIHFLSNDYTAKFSFALEEEDYKIFVEYLNSEESHKMIGDICNGHELIEIKKDSVSVSLGCNNSKFFPGFDFYLNKKFYRDAIAEFEKNKANQA